MYIQLVLKTDNTLGLAITFTANEADTNNNNNDSTWLQNWLARAPGQAYEQLANGILVNDLDTIEDFIQTYQENNGAGTSVPSDEDVAPETLFQYKNLMDIYTPLHLKRSYDEIRMHTNDLRSVSDSIFAETKAYHPAANYYVSDANSGPQSSPNSVMVVAPITDPNFLKALSVYQELIKTKFKLQDEAESSFHISLGVPLRLNNNELSRFSNYLLMSLQQRSIAVRPKALKSFQDSSIYLELEDVNNQLEQLHQEVLNCIHSSRIPYYQQNQDFVPHVTLFLKPATFIRSEELLTYPVDPKTYLLTSVALSKSEVVRGQIFYQKLLEQKLDILSVTLEMENDFHTNDNPTLYKSLNFSNNPVADYYQLRHKKGLIQNEQDEHACSELYKKILGFAPNSYPKNTHEALKLHARGLINLYPLNLKGQYVLGDETEQLQNALRCFNRAHELGYQGAARYIGIIHSRLGINVDVAANQNQKRNCIVM